MRFLQDEAAMTEDELAILEEAQRDAIAAALANQDPGDLIPPAYYGINTTFQSVNHSMQTAEIRFNRPFNTSYPNMTVLNTNSTYQVILNFGVFQND